MTLMHQIGEASRSLSLDSAALDFTKYAKVLMATKGSPDEALALATARGASSRLQKMLETTATIVAKATEDILTKSPVSIGSIDGGTWGSDLAPFQQASTAFAQSLAPFSCFDRIMSDGGFSRYPMRTRISIASTAALASSVSELAPKPKSAMSFAQVQLAAHKAVALLVISDELARSARLAPMIFSQTNCAKPLRSPLIPSFCRSSRSCVAAATLRRLNLELGKARPAGVLFVHWRIT